MIDTNDSDAPWNQEEPRPVGFLKKVNVYLTKNMELETTNFESHVDCDGFGYCVPENESDFIDDYKQNHLSIPELLDILKKKSEEQLQGINTIVQNLKNSGEKPASDILKEKRLLENIIEECSGWKEEDVDVDDI